MTTQKTISSLAIAAIALLAAAVPAFAQSKTNETFIATNRVVAAPNSGLNVNTSLRTAVPDTDVAAVEAKGVTESTGTGSAASFTTPAQFSVLKGQPSFSPQFKVYEPASFNSKPQFRSDDDNGVSHSRNGITFVPSKGQKLPS